MDEEELNSLILLRPFVREDALQAEAQAALLTGIGIALWGRTSADVDQQLRAPHPELPAGVELADLRNLQRSAEAMLKAFGGQRLTQWEARLEIVCRAIQYLDNR